MRAEALRPAAWILLQIVLLCSAPGPVLAADSHFAIGFPHFPAGINALESSHPAAMVLRSAVTRGLTARTGSDGDAAYRLDLSDNMSVSADYRRWSFRLLADVLFHNGRALAGEDVKASLLRCGESKLRGFGIRGISLRRVPALADSSREWVDVELAGEAPDSARRLQNFPAALADCPILEKESAVLFGADLGTGTNLVAAGDYSIAAFKSNGEIMLKRFASRALAGDTGAGISLRSFDDSTRALTALRGGTIDALFVADERELDASRDDETLVVSECLGFKILQRRGLEFPCQGTVSLAGMRYKS